MTDLHSIDDGLFDGLARGDGGPAAIEMLRSAQLSKHLLLIKEILAHWPVDLDDQRGGIEDALERSRRQDPVAFGDVLGAPLVGGWTAIVNRAVLRDAAAPDDFAYLAAWTAVACAATGTDADLAVPVRDGLVHVPGMGAAEVGSGPARLVATAGGLEVRAGTTVVRAAADDPRWLPIRYLSSMDGGESVRIQLDDLDPYRHGHHAPPAPRLAESDVDRWQALFGSGWQMLVEWLPSRAAEIRAGLRTLVPLTFKDDRSALSATIRHAFGVFGLTRPASAADFAVTLVHEFQHSKMSGLVDVMPLTDPADRRRFFAPWRVDPRPLAGLLQGIYAFVGVADTWRALRAVDSVSAHAETQFAEARLNVDRALTTVEHSGALTSHGEAVVARLRQTTDALLAEPVPAATAEAAERSLALTRERWLERNGPVDVTPVAAG